ncbi:MAG: aldo/keto reductase [Thermoplasmata archaeon]
MSDHNRELILGTYLGRPDLATDRSVELAAKLVLESGRMNAIDTAINYRLQRAERSVGRALAALIAAGRLERSEVFVATKVGYLAPDGESPETPQEWIRSQLIGPGILDPTDIADGAHAMSPSYLCDQVARSRENLGIETIDLVYLHNAFEAQRVAVGAREFDHRLRLAFETFEGMRSRGELRSYGIATWEALRGDREEEAHLDLASAVRLAESVGGAEHGFRFIQFPFNIAMPEAALHANQSIDGHPFTTFVAAGKLGLGCFTSVPLLQGELARTGPHYGALGRSASAIQFARSAPGALCALVGAKDPAHLSENLALAATPPWDAATFEEHLAARRSADR